MEIVPNKYRLRCELGLCKNLAEHTVKFSRAGIRSRIHLCGACLKELHETSGRYLAQTADKAAEKAAEPEGGPVAPAGKTGRPERRADRTGGRRAEAERG